MKISPDRDNMIGHKSFFLWCDSSDRLGSMTIDSHWSVISMLLSACSEDNISSLYSESYMYSSLDIGSLFQRQYQLEHIFVPADDCVCAADISDRSEKVLL